MVQSGLSERTDVSHYRLSLHLLLAFFVFILILWNYFKYKKNETYTHYKKIPSFLPIFFMFCVVLQIFLGAFVSGLNAAEIYQTWPLMNENF